MVSDITYTCFLFAIFPNESNNRILYNFFGHNQKIYLTRNVNNVNVGSSYIWNWTSGYYTPAPGEDTKKAFFYTKFI